MESKPISTLILVNPKARAGRSAEWHVREKQILEALGEERAQIEFTTPDDFGGGFVRKALQSGVRRIVVVGGDGTLSEAVQGFFDKGQLIAPDAVLMVMPGGRGDDFFKTLTNQRFYPGGAAWKKGLEILKTGTPLPVDLGRYRWIESDQQEPRYFLNIASFGYPGLVVHGVQFPTGILSNPLAKKSSLTYGLHGAMAFTQYKALTVEVKVDDRVFFDGPIHSGFVLNGRYNAGGICWDPEARLDDHLFNVVVVEEKGLATAVTNTLKFILGANKKVQGRHRIQGKKVEVTLKESEKKTHPLFEIDGDLFEDTSTRGAVFEILPGCIRIQS